MDLSAATVASYQFVNVIFDNPNALAQPYQNYSNISISDSNPPPNPLPLTKSYSITWTKNSAALPANRIPFAQKYLNITPLSSPASIDAIAWSWGSSELNSTYNESMFELWKYNGAWNNAGATLNTGTHTLSVAGLNPASIYGILQYNPPNCLVITSPGVYNMTGNYAGAPNDASDLIYNYSACVNSATKQCSATTRKSFNLPSPKLGVSYKLDNAVSAYLSVAQASQVPSDSETMSNNALNAARVRNVEVGLKGRAADWNFDAALYRTRVQDEIVSYSQNGQTIYENAGRTDKKGFEFSGGHRFARYYEAGINYAYSDYRFVDYVDSNGADLSGKRLNYVPRHQYGVYGSFRLPSGWRGRLQLNSWGQYFIDNANTETYGGYSWVANASLAYETGPHTVALNVDNLFDKHYASQVSKDGTGAKVSYSAAAPRSPVRRNVRRVTGFLSLASCDILIVPQYA